MTTRTLADALPEEIQRVTALRGQYEALRGQPNVMVEPQIRMMTATIDEVMKASISGEVIRMMAAYAALREWSE